MQRRIRGRKILTMAKIKFEKCLRHDIDQLLLIMNVNGGAEQKAVIVTKQGLFVHFYFLSIIFLGCLNLVRLPHRVLLVMLLLLLNSASTGTMLKILVIRLS